jgi:hypothetical protein
MLARLWTLLHHREIRSLHVSVSLVTLLLRSDVPSPNFSNSAALRQKHQPSSFANLESLAQKNKTVAPADGDLSSSVSSLLKQYLIKQVSAASSLVQPRKAPDSLS